MTISQVEQEQNQASLPGENILRALLCQIEKEASRDGWDKGHGPDHDVYHDTYYHDHNQGSPWSQDSPWPRA